MLRPRVSQFESRCNRLSSWLHFIESITPWGETRRCARDARRPILRRVSHEKQTAPWFNQSSHRSRLEQCLFCYPCGLIYVENTANVEIRRHRSRRESFSYSFVRTLRTAVAYNFTIPAVLYVDYIICRWSPIRVAARSRSAITRKPTSPGLF